MRADTKTKKFLLEEIEKLKYENEKLKLANKKLLTSQEMIDEFNSADEHLREILKKSENEENFSFNDMSGARKLFENNPHPMWIFDIQTLAFLAVNDAAIEKYGYSKKEFLNMTIGDIHPKKDISKLLKSISMPNARLDYAGSWLHRKKDGKIINVEIVSHTLTFKGRDAELVMANDITERKQTEEALRLSEIRFKGLISSMQDLVYTLDKNQNITGLYGMWSEMYGLSEELLLGKKLTTFLSPAQAEINDVANNRALNGESIKFEWSLNQNGDKFYFESSLTPFFGSNNEIVGIVGVAREITDRKKAELRIRESEEKYRKLFDFSPEPIMVHQHEKFLFINAAGVKFLGAENESRLIGKNVFDFLHPDYHQVVKERIVQLQEGAEKLPLTSIKFIRLDGSVIDAEVSTISFLHEGKLAAQVVLRDITERKITEDLLRESEDRNRSIIEYSPDAIAVHSNGKIIFVNPAAVKLIGAKSADELINKPVLELMHPDYKGFAKERIIRALRDNVPLPPAAEKIIKLDGTVIDVEITSVPINYGGTKSLQVILRDITEQKRANEQVKKLSQAVEQSPSSIIITDLSGSIEYVNPKFTKVTGYTFEEVIGKNPRILKSGSQSKEFYHNMWNKLTAGNDWKGELHNKKKAGELYWEFASISPIKNETGEITHFLAVKEDITEWKKIQEEIVRSKEEAEEASKIKSSLLANMSHEFRTPLNGVLGFSQLLKDEITDLDHIDMLEKIIHSGRRLMNTLNSVLTISELENNHYLISRSAIDLTLFCREIKVLYNKAASSKSLDFKLDIQDEIFLIISDENVLTKVMSSIIENAIKYTHQGEIRIELKHGTESNGEQYAIINVVDTGIGIRTEDQILIFREFKQLSEGYRRDFEGLGLGLTLANKMVKIIGGKITVQSEIGKGSIFTLMLPIEVQSETENIPAEQISVKKEIISDSVIRNGNELAQVLLIEDNPLNIEVVQRFLSKICAVSFARDGLTAIEMSKKDDYSLIMIDINLGQGMDGLQVLEEIKKLDKYENKPIVALTGYASDANKREFLALGFTHYLAKPFEKSTLIKLIKTILNLE